MSTFNVTMNVEDMQGKTVLVFLKPQNPLRSDRIHAWQVLTGSAGSTESFNYEAVMSTDVTSVGDNPMNRIKSARTTIAPGELYQAISPNNLSPKLEMAPTSLAEQKLAPEQAGVTNKTDPFIQFDANWYVNDRPVVTMPNVDANMTCSFEYLPIFYFVVATAPMIGQTFIVQNFSDMTQYVLPITATEVDVILTKVNGLWTFDFNANS